MVGRKRAGTGKQVEELFGRLNGGDTPLCLAHLIDLPAKDLNSLTKYRVARILFELLDGLMQLHSHVGYGPVSPGPKQVFHGLKAALVRLCVIADLLLAGRGNVRRHQAATAHEAYGRHDYGFDKLRAGFGRIACQLVQCPVDLDRVIGRRLRWRSCFWPNAKLAPPARLGKLGGECPVPFAWLQFWQRFLAELHEPLGPGKLPVSRTVWPQGGESPVHPCDGLIARQTITGDGILVGETDEILQLAALAPQDGELPELLVEFGNQVGRCHGPAAADPP